MFWCWFLVKPSTLYWDSVFLRTREQWVHICGHPPAQPRWNQEYLREQYSAPSSSYTWTICRRLSPPKSNSLQMTACSNAISNAGKTRLPCMVTETCLANWKTSGTCSLMLQSAMLCIFPTPRPFTKSFTLLVAMFRWSYSGQISWDHCNKEAQLFCPY